MLSCRTQRETFRVDGVSEDGWDVPFEGDLRVRWGSEEDAFDPLTQVRASFCGFRARWPIGSRRQTTRERPPLQELGLLSRAAALSKCGCDT